MIQKSAIILIIGLLSVSFAQQVSGDSLVKMLELAKIYYNSGEYEKAVASLENALQYLKQLNQIDQVEAYKYLAFSYVAQGDKEKAKEQFKNALALDPSLELDPTTVSPKIIKVFEEVKSEIAAKPPVVLPVKPPVKPVSPVSAKQVSTFGATMRSCCVPGWGQIYKGESSKGTKLIITSSILLSSTIITYVITDNKHQTYLGFGPDDPNGMEDAYRAYKFWYSTATLSLMGLMGVYLYNIYDVVFKKAKTKTSFYEPNNGLYCSPGIGQIQFGYNIRF